MSTSRRRLSLLWFALLILPAITSLDPEVCKAQDLLPETKARLAVEAQRVEKKFRDGRQAAYRMVRSDPSKLVDAVEQLFVLRTLLEGDRSLPATKRKQFLTTLAADVARLKRIARERRQANTPEARALRDRLRTSPASRPDPGKRVFEEAKGAFDRRRSAVASARDLRRLREGRYLMVGRSIERSAVLPAGDIEFPKDWAEKTKRRSKNKLTPKEAALLKALAAPISVDFTRETLSDVLDYFRKSTKQTIIVEKRALDELAVTYDSPITLKLRRTSTRTALKRVLADLGLTYVIKDAAILVTSVERAKSMMTTRTYYVGDLAGVVDVRFGPFLSRQIAAARVAQIMRLIVTSVEPRSWRINNPEGLGEIVFEPVTMSLIVRQSAEIHYQLQGAFR